MSGVYAYPPTPPCAARPSGVPYADLSRWTPPSVSGSFEVSLPWLGPSPVTGRLRAAGESTGRTRISRAAPAPMTVVEDRATRAQVPGFAAGIDLRRYRRVVFVADTSGTMCDYSSCNGNRTTSLPAPLLQVIGDQIDAAVAGLGPDQTFVLYAGSSWREIRYAPLTPAGRGLAGELVRGQVCTGNRGFRHQITRAAREGADVIVLFTSGGLQIQTSKYDTCDLAPAELYCYVNDKTEAVDLANLAPGVRVPPVVAVTVQRHDARWLQNLAEATGGAYVDLAP